MAAEALFPRPLFFSPLPPSSLAQRLSHSRSLFRLSQRRVLIALIDCVAAKGTRSSFLVIPLRRLSPFSHTRTVTRSASYHREQRRASAAAGVAVFFSFPELRSLPRDAAHCPTLSALCSQTPFLRNVEERRLANWRVCRTTPDEPGISLGIVYRLTRRMGYPRF